MSHVSGSGTAYDDYFVNQLTELALITVIYLFWFDGVCGEGPNEKTSL